MWVFGWLEYDCCILSFRERYKLVSEQSKKDQKTVVQEFWKNLQCPVISGILFGDGKLVQIHFYCELEDDSQRPYLEVLGTTFIDTFLNKSKAKITHLLPIVEKPIPSENLTILCGEAGYGSDGFVALSRSDSNELVWLAFFDTSNPFIKLALEDSKVLVATTNLGDEWRFSLKQPEKVAVKRTSQK